MRCAENANGFIEKANMEELVAKPEDAEWCDALAKLADFGTAKQILQHIDGDTQQQHTHNVGTGAFRAPEVRAPRQGDAGSQYYPQSDVYSLGKSMHLLRREAIAPLFRRQSPQVRAHKTSRMHAFTHGRARARTCTCACMCMCT